MADSQKFELIRDVHGILHELMRLAQSDSALREEQRFRPESSTASWQVRGCCRYIRSNKQMGISEEYQQVNMTQLTREVADITKFLGTSRPGAGASM